MKPIKGTWFPDWHLVWQRDDPFTVALDEKVYFNRRTGALLWEVPGVTGNEGYLAALHPDEWEEIPPLSHGDHHEIFRAWYDQLGDGTVAVDYTGSIGRFFSDNGAVGGPEMEDELRNAWSEFLQSRLMARAAEWLRVRGFAAPWADL